MRKLILILGLILTGMIIMAQTPNGYESWVADTTTDAETIYMALSSAKPITKDYLVTMTVIPANESGTATVVCTPQGSTDGSKWFDLQSVPDTTNNAGTAADLYYEFYHAWWDYYRLKLVSSGSGVSSFSGQLGLKKLN